MSNSNLGPVSQSTTNTSPNGDSYHTDASQNDAVLEQGLATYYKLVDFQNWMASNKYKSMELNMKKSRASQEQANSIESVVSKIDKPSDKKKLNNEIINYMRNNEIKVTSADGSGKRMSIDEFLLEKATGGIKKPDNYTPGCKAGDGFDLPDWAESASVDDLKKLTDNAMVTEGTLGWSQQTLDKAKSYLYDREIAGANDKIQKGEVQLDKGEWMVIKSSLEADASTGSDAAGKNQTEIQKLTQTYSLAINMISTLINLMAETAKQSIQKIS